MITEAATPWPWINYMGTEDFFSLISNTAGGYCFCKDAKFRRIRRRFRGAEYDLTIHCTGKGGSKFIPYRPGVQSLEIDV